MNLLLLILFVTVLFFASIMDMKTQKVYVFIWWIEIILITCLMVGQACRGVFSIADTSRLIELFIFILLQELLFSRMYGRADCHAFEACSAVLFIFGGEMMTYLLFMAAAFLLLTIIQIIKNNVGRDGNLKKPVAFIPYITCAFIAFLLSYV